MSALVPPQYTRQIGSVVINGKTVDVIGNPVWLRYWGQGLYERVGGATGPSTDEAAAEAGGNGGLEEVRGSIEAVAEELSQHLDHGRIGALEALVYELSARIDAMEQGPSL